MRLLLRYLAKYKLFIAVMLLVMLFDNVGTLLVPTMLAHMVNSGITDGSFSEILRGGAAMLGVSIMASGSVIIGTYMSTRLASRVACDIRCDLYDKSLQLSHSDFERFGTGSMITRTQNDVNVIQQSMVATIQMALPVPFLCVAGVVMACMIDLQMGLLLLAVVLIVLIIAVIALVKSAPIFMSLQSLIDRMNIVLRESIIGVRVIRAFIKERHEEQRLDGVFSDYAERAIRVNWLFAGLDCTAFFFMNIAEVIILWLGGNRVGAHAMQIASITAVLEYAMLILFFIMMAQMVILTLPRAKACLDRAAEVIDCKPEIMDKAGARADAGRNAANAPVASFEHASFRFADADEDTLHDLSFSCQRGQTTAIIGSTGSGKSTVAKMLLRFHDVTEGTVRVGGSDVRDFTQHDLRERISYVPQKAWLFSGTVASNLAYGNEGATEEDMRHALRIAQSDFVYELPGQLHARIAQGGTNLSGGQRQRISIARALIKKADLYIFDDSFSALDFKTDAALRGALVSEMEDAAVLIIAQRISTILHADQIVVLKDGRMVGLGTHEELMECCEVYRAIAASQMNGGERDE